jgi:hypothetical protein
MRERPTGPRGAEIAFANVIARRGREGLNPLARQRKPYGLRWARVTMDKLRIWRQTCRRDMSQMSNRRCASLLANRFVSTAGNNRPQSAQADFVAERP